MKIGMLSLGLALFALAGVGCGRPLAGSCSSKSGGVVISCIESHEGFTQEQVRASCPDSASVSFSTDPCPPENRIGRCEISLTTLGITVAQTLHYYPPLSSANAMADCGQRTAGGISATFSAN